MQSTDADTGTTAAASRSAPAAMPAGGDASGEGETGTLVHIPVRPKHLSPSSASMFRQCPQRWKFRYVDKLPDPPGEAALAGTFAHRVLEELLGLDATERTLESARSLAGQVWTEMESDKDFAALELDADGVRNFKWTAWRAIEGLWDLEDPTTVDIVATETEVSVEIGGVPFIGYIDRVEEGADGLVVSDYKSGRAPGRKFSESRLEQVLLYAAALTEIHGALPARARLMYLGQRIDEATVTAETIAEVTRRLAETWEELLERSATGDFPPQPGPLCGWCAFVRHCPEGLAEVERRHLAGALRPDAPALAEAV
ncbi:MAG: PD-(D/E)XK nuclease family protein [bacterium]|nr:PD-(D/E)XK nuclease family protein [bacterium]